MSATFGALGVISLRRPFAALASVLIGKGDLRSTLYAVVFFVVFLVLAYLTNPSENSFRTYLTEQSFRRHLSRLDENTDEDYLPDNEHHYSPSTCGSIPASQNRAPENHSPFHFANRASISLRTPKHVFHSFGIFTIAAMVPLSTADRVTANIGAHRDSSMISDSWFIGAFGKWWRGGTIEAWYQDLMTRSTLEESWSSGILGIKGVEKVHDQERLPFSTKNLPARVPLRGSPPRLRNRERVLQRNGTMLRSASPPPLPKSVSLPLHANRIPPSPLEIRLNSVDNLAQPLQVQPSLSLGPCQTLLESPSPSRSPSTLFEQSPIIEEILRQIAQSKTGTQEIRDQLNEFQATASESHAALQGEVNAFRDRKRQEDASRVDLKLRSKVLEDSKRNAESSRRDAEKKLKSAQNARNEATQRMEKLDKDISELRHFYVDHRSSPQQTDDALASEREITDALEHKKQEIRVAEEVVVALSSRARDLEEQVASERERLRVAKERANSRKKDQSIHPLLVSPDFNLWSPTLSEEQSPTRADYIHPNHAVTEPDPSSSPQMRTTSPRPANLSLGGLSNFKNTMSDPNHMALRAKGYSIFDDDIASLTMSQTRACFSPFEQEGMQTSDHGAMIMPMGASLIPSGLINSFESSDMSRPAQTNGESYMDREWRSSGASLLGAPLNASPIAIQGPAFSDRDLFEIRQYLPSHEGPNPESPTSPIQRFSILHRTHSDPTPPAHEEVFPEVDRTGPRRWFSTKEKPRKGLNPDAKVFSLAKKPSSFDALNPNGLGSGFMSSTNTSLIRAFAPSPAEREALQRAMGGSSNVSLERLPSLSDMGSIPSSPSHVNTDAQPLHHTMRDMGSVLPSWLQSLPRIRKPNFSPWDDDETLEVAGNGK